MTQNRHLFPVKKRYFSNDSLACSSRVRTRARIVTLACVFHADLRPSHAHTPARTCHFGCTLLLFFAVICKTLFPDSATDLAVFSSYLQKQPKGVAGGAGVFGLVVLHQLCPVLCSFLFRWHRVGPLAHDPVDHAGQVAAAAAARRPSSAPTKIGSGLLQPFPLLAQCSPQQAHSRLESPGVGVARNHCLTFGACRSRGLFPRPPGADQFGLSCPSFRCPAIGHRSTPIL